MGRETRFTDRQDGSPPGGIPRSHFADPPGPQTAAGVRPAAKCCMEFSENPALLRRVLPIPFNNTLYIKTTTNSNEMLSIVGRFFFQPLGIQHAVRKFCPTVIAHILALILARGFLIARQIIVKITLDLADIE